MGRSIGGAVVGFLTYYIGMGIIVVVLAFVLKADGIRDPQTLAPTMAWMAAMLIAGTAMAYLGAAVTRAIAKQKLGTFIFAGLVLLLVVYGLASQNKNQELPPETPEVFKALAESQTHAPMWSNILGTLLAFAGIALGGFSKGDFGKPDTTPNMPA
jgi:hypothetical protein